MGRSTGSFFPLERSLPALGISPALGIGQELCAKYRLVKRTSKGRSGFIEKAGEGYWLLEPGNPVNSNDSSASYQLKVLSKSLDLSGSVAKFSMERRPLFLAAFSAGPLECSVEMHLTLPQSFVFQRPSFLSFQSESLMTQPSLAES